MAMQASSSVRMHGSAVPTESAASDFWTSGFTSSWVPTLLSPNPENTWYNRLFWHLHLYLWILVLFGAGAANGGAAFFFRTTPDCDEFKYDCYQYEQSQWTFIISITSAVCTAIGFALLIIGCSIWNIREIRFETEFVTLMLTFMSTGLTGSLFVYTRYAVKEATAGFWVSSFVNIAYLYALTLLYSVCAYARVVALPRAFLLCFTFSVTFVNAVAIMANEFSLGDHWSTGKPLKFAAGQKFAAVCVPVLVAYSLLSVFILRRVTRNSINVSTIGRFPFVRSTMMFTSAVAAVLSIYVHSYASRDTDFASGTFTLAGTVLCFLSMATIWAPSGKAFAERAPPLLPKKKGSGLDDEEEDEE